MRILLTGRGGQVGTELEGRFQALGEVMATDRTRLDITNSSQVARVMREWAPHVVINAADGALASRPGYSVLDSSLASFRFGITLPPWEHGLDAVIAQVRKSGSSQAQDLR